MLVLLARKAREHEADADGGGAAPPEEVARRADLHASLAVGDAVEARWKCGSKWCVRRALAGSVRLRRRA